MRLISGFLEFPKLPSICVIGPQSSGKTSLLQRIINRDKILPIGKELTTKCIIQIKLRSICTSKCLRKQSGINRKCDFAPEKSFSKLLNKLDLLERLEAISSTSKPDSYTESRIILNKYDDQKVSKKKKKDKKLAKSDEIQNILLDEYAIFDDKTDQIFPLESVQAELKKRMNNNIEGFTEKIENSESYTNDITEYFTISDKVIKITLFLHNTLPLTLLDLPGIINISKNKKQNLSYITKEIAKKYAKSSDIILAVINGCVDIVNSESLALANEVNCLDKVVGVFTKLDKTNLDELENIFRNEEIFLEHGYHGVVNYDVNKILENANFTSNQLDLQDHHEKLFFEQSYLKNYNLGILSLKKYLASLFESSCQFYFDKILEKFRNDIIELKRMQMPHFKYKFIEKWTSNINNIVNFYINHILYKIDTISTTHHVEIIDKEISYKIDTIFFDEKTFKMLLTVKIDFVKEQILNKIDLIFNQIILHLNKQKLDDDPIESEFSNDKNDEIILNDIKINKNPEEHNKESFLVSLLPFLKKENSKNLTKEPKNIEKQINSNKIGNINSNKNIYSTFSFKENKNISLLESYQTKILNNLKDQTIKSLTFNKEKLIISISEYVNIQLNHINLKHDNLSEIDNSSFNTNSLLSLTKKLMYTYINKYYLILKKEIVNYSVKSIFYYFTKNEIIFEDNLENLIMDDYSEIEKILKIIDHKN